MKKSLKIFTAIIFSVCFLSFLKGHGMIIDSNSIIPALGITESALDAARIAMEITAENIANQHTTRDENGECYRTKKVSFQVEKGKSQDDVSRGVRVDKINRSKERGSRIYDPDHPHADSEGFVERPNVKIAEEMVNLTKYSRWIEAEYVVAKTSSKMVQQALDLVR